MEQANTWGGARPGAGRKPKAMHYAPVLNAVEAYFASELMDIAMEMVKRAKQNNDNIAKYIMNHMFGSPARLEDSPATDRMLPYNDANLENAVKRLIEHSPNNSSLNQVIAEILADTICTPQTIIEKSTSSRESVDAPAKQVIPEIPIIDTPKDEIHAKSDVLSCLSDDEKETSLLQGSDVISVETKSSDHLTADNTDWIFKNMSQKTLDRICQYLNIDPNSASIAEKRGKLRTPP